MKSIFVLICGLLIAGGIFNSCTSGGADGSNPGRDSTSYTYSTTSNVGDYTEWTFDGSTISATWQVINGSGNVDMTYTVVATCPVFNSTYGYYSCNITTGGCTPGASACSGTPSGTFDMMEVPNTAIFVHTGSGASSQLHVGLLKDSTACSAIVSGDYVYARTGLGSRELFGIYRTDNNFLSVVHADFSMYSSASATTPVIEYTTQDASGTGAVTLSDGGCSGGVRTRGAGGGNLRAMMTNSGLFILDMPSGQGGLVSFKMANAATLTDFENKTFGGISFPDNGSPSPILAVTGTSSSNAVAVTSGDVNGTPIGAVDIRPLTNNTSAATSPSFPDYSVAPASGTYAANTVLQGAYPTPNTFPGIFRIDGAVSDSGRVMMAAAKLNGKVVAFGFVYNWRDSGQTNPATGLPFSSNGLYNTGNFILFER